MVALTSQGKGDCADVCFYAVYSRKSWDDFVVSDLVRDLAVNPTAAGNIPITCHVVVAAFDQFLHNEDGVTRFDVFQLWKLTTQILSSS